MYHARQSFPIRGLWARLPFGLILGTVLAGCAWSGGHAGDPQAGRLAGQALKSVGGRRAVEGLRYLHFDFVITENGREILRRSHWWDRKTGRSRLEGKADGRPYVILFNSRIHEGKALEMFQPAPPDRTAVLVRQAEALQAGDAFWLLSVMHLNAPGARVSRQGENPVDGRICPTLGLEPAAASGLDPRDRISFYLHPATGRPLAWTFTLGSEPGRPQTYTWDQWQTVGECELPVAFSQVNGPRRVRIEDLYAPGEIEPRVFFEF